jgi:hypothetical protein
VNSFHATKHDPRKPIMQAFSKITGINPTLPFVALY